MNPSVGAWIKAHWPRITAASVWIVLLGAGVIWAVVHGLSVRDILAIVYNFVDENPLAPLVYLAVYALRCFTLFPAMWLTVAAGSLFGFFPGIIWALIGENLSAHVAYALARFFRRDDPEKADETRRLSLFRRLLRRQAFPTVLVLRAAYLPFDVINYGCGLLRVPWLPYLFGSLIGMLPPMITFVSFGAAIDFRYMLSQEGFSPSELIDASQLMISGVLVLISIVIALWAQRRQRRMVWDAREQTQD